jgi:hypothetical protein
MKRFLFAFMLSLNYFCQNPIDYDVQLLNSTGYTLNEINVGWCNQEMSSFNLSPNESSEIYTFIYEETIANLFAPGTLCISISSYYIDVNNVIYNNWGSGIERSELDDNNLSLIEITYNPDSYGNVFEIKKIN